MDHGIKLWEQTLNVLKQELDESDYSVLFSEADQIYKVENNFIYIIVPNALTKYRIEKFYINKLNDIVASLSDSLIKFKFILKDEMDEMETSATVSKDDVSKRPLRAEYT